jgi:hypothetical protein
MAEVVGCLNSKCKALNSNPSITKKREAVIILISILETRALAHKTQKQRELKRQLYSCRSYSGTLYEIVF